jgi:hypothetical protein
VTIIGGLFSLLGRFAGQILNTTLGWATLLLFGKVPQSRQTLLLVIVFGSLVWVALIIGIAAPPVGTLLVASVPMSDAVDPNWIRIGMFTGALAVPVAIGLAAAFVSEDATERRPGALIRAGIRGYPFAFTLTLMLGLLAAVAIGRKIRSLSHKWEDSHIPMVVKPGAYEAVLDDVERALDDAQLHVAPRDAGTLLSGPPKLLDKIAGRGLGTLVPDRLMILAGHDIEVLVYPSDLAISGTRDRVARARAALASRVSNAPAYLTTSAESQRIEDVLDKIRDEGRKAPPEQTLARLHTVDERLASLAVPYEEWQVLYRLRLQLERDARAAMDHDEATIAPELGDGGQRSPGATGGRGIRAPIRAAIGLGGAALVAVDVALQVADRKDRNGPNGRD